MSMPRKKPSTPLRLEDPGDAQGKKPDPAVCVHCGGPTVRGELSSVANFGVTREPHFVTSFGWMQVKYDRATEVDSYMCLDCGHIQFFGRSPQAVLDPLERQQHIREQNPELDKKLKKEEKKRKELEQKGQPLSGDEHTGI